MRRILLLTLLLPVFTAAQSVRVTFATESPRKVWAAASVQDAPPPVVSSSSKEHTIANASGHICILDEATGNLASRPAKGLTTWVVKDADFSLIAELQITAEPLPRPASFTCQGQTFLILPNGPNTSTFRGLKPGPIEASLTYDEGGKNTTKKQTFEVGLKRSEPIPKLIIGLPSTSTPKPPPAAAAPVKAGGSIVGTLVAILIVAAIAIAILIFGMKWIYANQDKTKQALGKLGVQVPDPLDPAPDPIAPPVNPISDPTPMAAIVLPGADPIPTARAVGVPRLVGSVGSFELSEGVHVIGREPGLTISMVGESTLSRRHAEIVVAGAQITLRDLGSTNGTFVNGQPATSDVQLRVGDSVRFGSVQFKLE